MTGKRIGYIRVSSDDQNPDRQLNGLEVDKKFIEYASGKDTNRPQLIALLDYIREGDTLYVHSMDRLARNLADLLNLVTTLTNQQIRIEFLKENLVFTGEDSSMSKLLLSIMGAVAEFERTLIRERQAEGIKLAIKRGAFKGGQYRLSSEQVLQIKELVEQGIPKAKVARKFKISRKTLYRALEEGYGVKN